MTLNPRYIPDVLEETVKGTKAALHKGRSFNITQHSTNSAVLHDVFVFPTGGAPSKGMNAFFDHYPDANAHFDLSFPFPHPG